MKEEIQSEIETIVKALGGDLSGASSTEVPLADVGLDSLSTMDLVLSIEEKFGIQIPDEKLNSQNLNNISSLVNLVAELR